MTLAMDAGARRRLDAHLDAVERVLVEAGHPREQRRGIIDDLEAHIAEILGRRTSEATEADVAEVLAALDPPSAYAGVARADRLVAGAPPSPGAPAQPDPSRLAPSPLLPPVAPAGSSIPPAPRIKRRFLVKPSVIVALIVCGTLLLMTPALYAYFQSVNTAGILKVCLDFQSVNITGLEADNEWCLHAGGMVAIISGVLGAAVSFLAEISRPSFWRA